MGLPIIGDVIKGVGAIVDDLHTSGEEKRAAELEERKLDLESERLAQQLVLAQAKVNEVEAGHPSLWVSGARPGVMWVCVCGLAYNFILYPVLTWGWVLFQAWKIVPRDLAVPAVMDISELMPLLIAMLGLGAMQSYDKTKGVETKRVVKGF